jgi:hypothetical protein
VGPRSGKVKNTLLTSFSLYLVGKSLDTFFLQNTEHSQWEPPAYTPVVAAELCPLQLLRCLDAATTGRRLLRAGTPPRDHHRPRCPGAWVCHRTPTKGATCRGRSCSLSSSIVAPNAYTPWSWAMAASPGT